MFTAFTLSALTLVGATTADDSYRFAVVGHVRGGPGDGVVPREKLARLAAELRKLELDFVVLTGDIVWGDFETEGAPNIEAIRADFDEVDALLAGVGAPIHRTPGNHDLWDALTRDLWLERYGELYFAFEHRGSRFVFLCTPWTPSKDGQRCPGRYIRGAPLPPEQVAFVAEQMQLGRGAEHVFVFGHHLLWWPADAPWRRDVHPLFAQAPVRAVFAGDLGPWKFSHELADGVHYLQSAVDFSNLPPLSMRRNREESRSIVDQLDNYLVVTVDGPRVEFEVEVFGALEDEHRDAANWRAVHEHDAGTFRRKLFERMNTSERAFTWVLRIGALAAGLGLVFGAGLGLWVGARRARRRPS